MTKLLLTFTAHDPDDLTARYTHETYSWDSMEEFMGNLRRSLELQAKQESMIIPDPLEGDNYTPAGNSNLPEEDNHLHNL